MIVEENQPARGKKINSMQEFAPLPEIFKFHVRYQRLSDESVSNKQTE